MTPLFFSKNNPRIHFVSPVAGEILAISRGQKRKILEVVISSQKNNNDSVKFKTTNFKKFSADEIKDILLKSGSWPFILQRPYGIIAQPEDKPVAIYISTYSTSPLDVDFDFILIGGDLIDSSQFKLSDLEIFKKIKKPILFCTGNHDYYIKGSKDKLNQLSKYNITYLNNRSKLIKNFNIIGINDNQSIEEQKNVALRYFDKNRFNIYLTHKPSLFNILNLSGLVLSGHTHNGQIFPFNLIVKIKFPHVYGFFKKGNTDLYVSSGSGCWGPRMRLGSNNEIIILEFI